MEQQRAISVLVVDAYTMVRCGINAFLSLSEDIAVVGEAADGAEAFERCAALRPDVILMDVAMPKVDGIATTVRIRQAFPQVQVIAMTSFVDEALVPSVIQAGAISYLVKDVYADQLADAIRAAYHGRSTFAPGAAHALAQLAAQASALRPDLSKREREVLMQLVAGRTNSQIASQLAIHQSTVGLHVSNILTKLGVSNRTEAAMLAVQHKLIA